MDRAAASGFSGPDRHALLHAFPPGRFRGSFEQICGEIVLAAILKFDRLASQCIVRTIGLIETFGGPDDVSGLLVAACRIRKRPDLL